MIKSIKSYFEGLLKTSAQNTGNDHKTVALATTVLMIEISLADETFDEQERQTIKTQLLTHFDLAETEIDPLIQLAENEVDHATSLYEFTSLLNQSFNAAEKINIVESLWRIAYADAVVDKYEEYYIRKIADLLYVSHANYIQAKLKAQPS